MKIYLVPKFCLIIFLCIISFLLANENVLAETAPEVSGNFMLVKTPDKNEASNLLLEEKKDGLKSLIKIGGQTEDLRKRKEANENLEDKVPGKSDEINMKKLEKSSRHFSEEFKKTRLMMFGITEFGINQFWSPFNAMSSIGMLLLGSEGTTKSQIQEIAFSAWIPNDKSLKESQESLLQLTEEISKPYKTGNDTISVAYRLYIQNNFKVAPKFVEKTKKYYNADAKNIDFKRSEETRNTINRWVEEKTKNKIKNLLPKDSLTSDTRLVSINAIYFLGTWKYQFNSSLTKKRNFYIPKTWDNANTNFTQPNRPTKPKTIKVDMMYAESKFEFCRLDGVKAEMLKLDYADERLSMFIILPDEVDGAPRVLKNYSDFNHENCKEQLRPIEAEILIPKFEIEAEYKMKRTVTKMGMNDLFTPNKANLSGISKQGQLYVDEIYHKAFIKVDEDGTEAAAASGAVINMESLGKYFNANHPFLFKIVENKFGNVVFEGYLVNPSI